MDRHLLITCEHAGNQVPEEYKHLFEQHKEVLNTHRGLDIGALELTATIGKVMSTEPYIHKVTRLLVDLNRSLHNPSAFSEFLEGAGQEERERIVENYYMPHRREVHGKIAGLVEAGTPVIHIAIHTFTPELDGVKRNADIGFLFHPKRESEKELCRAWRREMQRRIPDLTYRMNYPYRGTMDGFSTQLKGEFEEEDYWGVTVEVNQKFPQSEEVRKWQKIQDEMALSLKKILGEES